jgi:tRNA uridine 5-carbamoylmethylation protein Kti12
MFLIGEITSMSELVMLVGIPCSGKSTCVEKLKKVDYWKNSVVLSTDNYIEEQAKRLGMTYNEVFQDCIDEATRQLEIAFIEAKDKGKDIIWDQTNISRKSRRKKLSKLPSYYRRGVIYFEVSLEEALKRNENRDGKHIPKSVLRRMYYQFEVPIISEGFDYVRCVTQETKVQLPLQSSL